MILKEKIRFADMPKLWIEVFWPWWTDDLVKILDTFRETINNQEQLILKLQDELKDFKYKYYNVFNQN